MIVRPVSTVIQELPGVFRWTHAWSLALGDIGISVGFDFLKSAPRSMTTSGTDGVGGTVIYEGSIDNGIFAALAPPIDTLLNSPLAVLLGEYAFPHFIRPHCTAGDGTTNYTVTFILRRSYR
jgi:hypothetical protein